MQIHVGELQRTPMQKHDNLHVSKIKMALTNKRQCNRHVQQPNAIDNTFMTYTADQPIVTQRKIQTEITKKIQTTRGNGNIHNNTHGNSCVARIGTLPQTAS